MKYFNLLNLTFVYLFIFALISVRKKIGGGFEPRLGGKQIRDLPLSYKVVCDTSLCLLTYTNNSSPIKKKDASGIRTQEARVRLRRLTTTLQPCWWFRMALNIYDSLFHIQSDGTSKPRGSTGLVKLLLRDHVARAQLVSPSFFLFNL
jgi:hypothetical protein